MARLDHQFTKVGRLTLFHSVARQRIDAFKFVAGQNPDTELHSHDSRLGWSRDLSPVTMLQAGLRFQTTRSVLKPEPNALVPASASASRSRSWVRKADSRSTGKKTH